MLGEITSVGRPAAAITDAIVNVFPAPVAPGRALWAPPAGAPRPELGDRLGLVSGRPERGDEAEGPGGYSSQRRSTDMASSWVRSRRTGEMDTFF